MSQNLNAPPYHAEDGLGIDMALPGSDFTAVAKVEDGKIVGFHTVAVLDEALEIEAHRKAIRDSASVGPTPEQKKRTRNLMPFMALAALFGLDRFEPRRLYTWARPGYHGGPYMPHQGKKECARRRKQMHIHG